MRRRAKVDSNHKAIVTALRKAGCSVQSLAEVGDGCPDILVGVASRHEWHAPRRMFLAEIKDGSKSPSERRLTPDQEQWHREWKGPPVLIIESIEQALEAVK